jgi:protein TonB
VADASPATTASAIDLVSGEEGLVVPATDAPAEPAETGTGGGSVQAPETVRTETAAPPRAEPAPAKTEPAPAAAAEATPEPEPVIVADTTPEAEAEPVPTEQPALPQVDPGTAATVEPEAAPDLRPVVTDVPVGESAPETMETAPVETTPEPEAPAADPVAEEPVISDPEPVYVPAKRGDLVDYHSVDREPVAVKRTAPMYHPLARQLRQEGQVVMRLLISEVGEVEEVEFVWGISGSKLNLSAIKAARKWKYEPAMKDGVPVKVWKTEVVQFKL